MRTDELMNPAGVAIMALGSLAKNPDSRVKIVPIGMNYFQAHKFRSRAVVEIGSSIEISPELVEKYQNEKKREAIGELLDTIYESLIAVTVTSPDYDTLMVRKRIPDQLMSTLCCETDVLLACSCSKAFVYSKRSKIAANSDY